MLKVAVVGCGKIADGHVEEVQKMPGRARVVAVCDREKLMAEQLAVRYGIPAHYDRLEELLERERPDVVHITTPPQSHVALGKQVIDAGCHVFVEKPVALDNAQARELITHAQAKNKKLTVGYLSFFEPPALAMRELIDAGVLGEPVHVESFYGYDLRGPFGKVLLGDGRHWVHGLPGKLFHNIIDHMLNKVTEFVRDENPIVQAMGYARRPERFGDMRDEFADELRVMVRGGNVSGYATFSSHIRPVGQFVRVYGTKNTLHLDYVARTVTIEASPSLPSAIGRLVPAFQQAARYFKAGTSNVIRFAKADFHYFAGMHELISRFYDCIETDGEPPVAYADILRISALMDEIFRQVAAQRKNAE